VGIARPQVCVAGARRNGRIRIAVVGTIFHSGTVTAGADVLSVGIARPQVCVAGAIINGRIRIAVVDTTFHTGTGSTGADVLSVGIARPPVLVVGAVRRRSHEDIAIDNDDYDDRDDDSSD